MEPIFITKQKVFINRRRYIFTRNQRHGCQTASLDRIDSSKGYVEGNIRWVHKTINCLRQNMSDPEFISWCQKVTNHYNKEVSV